MASAKVIVVAGAGPGISTGVAEKFGSEGFKVALLSRTKSRLDDIAADLEKKGITAKGFPVDLSDPSALKATLAQVSQELGAITVLHWNAYGPAPGGVLSLQPEALTKAFELSVNGLLVAAQALVPELEAQAGSAAILVTGGGLYISSPEMDELCENWQASGLALVKGAQHKTVGLLAAAFKSKGVYVGEVTVMSVVKGSAFDAAGQGTLSNSTVGDKFWELYTARSETFVQLA